MIVCIGAQNGWAALHVAAHEGKLAVVQRLIEAQAHINIQTEV